MCYPIMSPNTILLVLEKWVSLGVPFLNFEDTEGISTHLIPYEFPRDHHNKAPLTGWLETTDMYCLTVLQVRSPQSDIHSPILPLKPVESFYASSQLLVVAITPWPSLAYKHKALQSLPLLSYGILFTWSSYNNISHIILRASPALRWPHLN